MLTMDKMVGHFLAGYQSRIFFPKIDNEKTAFFPVSKVGCLHFAISGVTTVSILQYLYTISLASI